MTSSRWGGATGAGGPRRVPCPTRRRASVDYGYLIDDSDVPRPDPRSRRQPDGVHGRSRTFDPGVHVWGDEAWTGRQLAGSVIYELHLGTFTPEGTLDAALDRLDHLRSIGVDFVELMPVNAFNGTHNWGYDGVDWFAVDETYGGPAAYQRFVDACHAAGLGVIQDVVYNHLGPSGNYLPLFGPYLKQGRNTWGDLVNLDGDGSAEVRRYIIDNALMWLGDHHVDGLRLDAVHALQDTSETHLLEELAIEVAALSAHRGVPLTLIAESDLNDPRLVTPREAGGYGLDAQWSDDFHHAVHVALTGETDGYYADFAAAGGAGQGVREGLLPRRHLLLVPRGRPRRADRHRRDADLAAGGLQPEPRPDRQPRRRRPDHREARRRPARVRGAAHAVRPVHPDAVPGRGVGGIDAVPVLHLPPRARARARRPPRAGSGSSPRWAGTLPSCPTPRTRRPSPAPSSTGRRPSRAAGRGCSRSTDSSPPCGGSTPR